MNNDITNSDSNAVAVSEAVTDAPTLPPTLALAPAPVEAKAVRGPLCRWVMSADLMLESAARIAVAGGVEDGLDVLLQHPTGAALIPGTSLAGALRAHLAAMLRESPDPREGEALLALFGSGDGTGTKPGALTVCDAFATIGKAIPRQVQAGHGIDKDSGVATNDDGWSRVVMPAGITFSVRFEVEATADPQGDALLSVLVAGLEALASGEIRLGLGRSRGLGKVSCTHWRARRFPLSNAAEWNTWLASDHVDPFLGMTTQPKPSVMDALRDAGASPFVHPIDRPRRRALIEANVNIPGSMLIAGSEAEPSAPDRTHVMARGYAAIPATSLAGAFRARARQIASIVRAKQGDGDQWVARTFGSEYAPSGGRRRDTSFRKTTASLVQFNDATIEQSRPLRQTRVQLDRFTQNLVDTAPDSEQASVGGRSVIRIEMLDWSEPELGLLLLVLKDFLSEDLPLGGGKSIGRGTVRGRANVTFVEPLVAAVEDEVELPDGGGAIPKAKSKRKPARRAAQFPRATIEPGKAPGGDAGARINACIWAFQDAPALASSVPEMQCDDGDDTDDADSHIDDSTQGHGEDHRGDEDN